MSENEEPNRWKGYITGAIGGVAGTFVMGYYWQAAKALNGDKDPRQETNENAEEALDISLIGKHHTDEESSTAALGRILYTDLAGEAPKSEEAKTIMSNIVHYAYGIKQGANYGAVRADSGPVDLLGAVVWGTGLWALGDELGVSVLGLADGPGKYPIKQHLYRWGAHLSYSLTASLVARLLYKVF